MHLGLEIGFLFARGQQQGEVLGMPVGQGGVRGRLLRVTVADRLGVVDAPIVPDEGLNQEPSDASRYNQTPADTIRRQQVQQIRCTQEHASIRWAYGLSWPQVPIAALTCRRWHASQSVAISHNQGAHLTYRRWHASQSVTIKVPILLIEDGRERRVHGDRHRIVQSEHSLDVLEGEPTAGG